MEVTPKAFREVQFREKGRGGGYHPEDVDEFLEQAAVGVEQLLERLRQADERVQKLEKTATESAGNEELLKRTLVLAQRTADQVVQEAREEATRLVADARSKGEALLAEGATRGQRAYEEAIADQRANLEAAEAALRQVQQEVDAIRAWVDQNRAHLLNALKDAQALVQSAGLLSEPPAVTSVAAPAGSQGTPDQVQSGEVESASGSPELGAPVAAFQPATVDEQEVRGEEWLFTGNVGEGTGPGRPASPPGAAMQQEAIFPPPPVGATGVGSGPQAGHGEPAEPSEATSTYSGPPTMALDERALESFFSDQDLDDERRSSGRLRHRH
jgi:cell division initiation protein